MLVKRKRSSEVHAYVYDVINYTPAPMNAIIEAFLLKQQSSVTVEGQTHQLLKVVNRIAHRKNLSLADNLLKSHVFPATLPIPIGSIFNDAQKSAQMVN